MKRNWIIYNNLIQPDTITDYKVQKEVLKRINTYIRQKPNKNNEKKNMNKVVKMIYCPGVIKKAIYSFILVLIILIITPRPGTAQLEENLPPVANLYLNPSVHLSSSSVKVLDEVFFIGSDSYDPNPNDNITFLWDFGDGNHSNETSPIHIFPRVGEYTIKLTVNDGNLSDTSLLKLFVYSEGGNPPVAKIVVDSAKDASGSNYANVSEPILFDASGSFDPDGFQLTYKWDFDDGSTSSQKIVSHEFESDGTYTVVLTINDLEELMRQESITIKIGTGESSSTNNGQASEDDNFGTAIAFLVGGVVIVFILLILWFFIGRFRQRTIARATGTGPQKAEIPEKPAERTGMPEFLKPDKSSAERASRRARVDQLKDQESKLKQVMLRKKLQDERRKLDDDMKKELKDMGIEL